LVEDNDVIEIDAVNNTINVKLDEQTLSARRSAWKQPPLTVSKGILYKYAKQVTPASEGCITDK
jgi:dihydroxy-acid dehydratase